MPDWLTHVGIVYLICRLLKIKENLIPIALFGALLPDINKILHIAGVFMGKTLSYELPFHTPVAGVLLSFIISQFFEKPKNVFLVLFLGFMIYIP